LIAIATGQTAAFMSDETEGSREPKFVVSCLPRAESRRRAMRAVGITLVAAATLAWSAWSVPVVAAEQGTAGMVSGINRLNGTIAITRIQNGTVGANAAGAAEEFKIKDNAMIENIHAGDRVTFSTSDSGTTKTIIKLDRQK